MTSARVHRWRRSPDVAWQRSAAGDGTVLVLLLGGEPRPLAFDLAGSAVWLAVDGQRSEDEVIEVVAAQFSATVAEVAADVSALLLDLASRGLLAPEVPHAEGSLAAPGASRLP